MGGLDLVFPKKCLNCGKEGKYVCENCLSKVKNSKAICPYCKEPSIYGMTHPKCSRVDGLDGLTSLFRYTGVVRKAILALKYKYATEIAKELSAYLMKELKGETEMFKKGAILIPIPLHWYRDNFRGFNQSEIIGKEVAKNLNWKFIPGLLIRKRSTAPQTTLKKHLRPPNIAGAFALSPNTKLSGYSQIIIFDDVFTTGSTIKEATSILKRNGAKSVWGLTIAR